MNIPVINSIFEKFKQTYIVLKPTLESISSLELEIAEKKTRNTNLFNSTINTLIEKESYIKSNSDNKFNTYMKYIDFLNEEDIYEINNFEVHSKTGSLIKKQTTEAVYVKPDNIVFSGDETYVECFFYKGLYYNEINYEFYDSLGIAVTPKSVAFVNNKVETQFYEPNFRYFNMNNEGFNNTFYFTAKKINSIKFYFDKVINKKNFKITLRTKNYSTNINDYVILRADIKSNLNSYSIFKNSDEYNIKLLYSYSYDNITYTDFKFDEYDKFSFSGSKGKKELFIKLKSDYDNYNTSEKFEKISNNYKSKSSYTDEVTLKLDTSELVNYKITFTQSQYKKLKEAFDSEKLDITKFIQQDLNGIYQVLETFIKKISNYDYKNLYYYDDLGILKETTEKFNFVFDDKKGVIYISAFMNQFDYIINVESKNFLVGIDSKLFTPSVFDISIKG